MDQVNTAAVPLPGGLEVRMADMEPLDAPRAARIAHELSELTDPLEGR